MSAATPAASWASCGRKKNNGRDQYEKEFLHLPGNHYDLRPLRLHLGAERDHEAVHRAQLRQDRDSFSTDAVDNPLDQLWMSVEA